MTEEQFVYVVKRPCGCLVALTGDKSVIDGWTQTHEKLVVEYMPMSKAFADFVPHCPHFTDSSVVVPISLSEAAKILHGESTQRTRMRVKMLIDRGVLVKYKDADEPNPQHATRVNLTAVMKVQNSS